MGDLAPGAFIGHEVWRFGSAFLVWHGPQYCNDPLKRLYEANHTTAVLAGAFLIRAMPVLAEDRDAFKVGFTREFRP